LRTLGVRTIPRGPRRATAADPDGLTPRQREVSELVAAGLTDAQIAARLHLSVKTVGHHVSAVLAKTQSTTRRDLYKPRDV
jgi:DNA-binding NarL/FixJ family response regulator